MERPSQDMQSQLTEKCPNCSSATTPVVFERSQNLYLSAAYRCLKCATDFQAVWQYGYVRANQPPLPFDYTPTNSPPLQQPNQSTPQSSTVPSDSQTTINEPACISCGSPPGAKHAIACQYA